MMESNSKENILIDKKEDNSVEKNKQNLKENEGSYQYSKVHSNIPGKENCLKRKSKTIEIDYQSEPKICCPDEASVAGNKEEIVEEEVKLSPILNMEETSISIKENESNKELNSPKDYLKSDREKVKRRRSSFGRCLIKGNSEPVHQNIETIDHTSKSERLLENSTTPGTEGEKNISNKTEVISRETNAKSQEVIICPRIKIYEEKSKKLEVEYRTWKKLLSSRKQRAQEAQRELRESKKGETEIEEDQVLPYLKREHKTILLSQPNYEQYLQEIKRAKEEMILINKEVQRISIAYHSFSKLSNLVSKCCIRMIEESLFPNVVEKDPKVLLKALMDEN